MAKGKRASGDEPLSKAQEAVQAEVQQAKKVVRQKKVFELPGQIREAPLEVRAGVDQTTSPLPRCTEQRPCRATHCASSTPP